MTIFTKFSAFVCVKSLFCTITESTFNICRPASIAKLSLNGSANSPTKSLEERVGLPPRPKKPLTPYFRFMREVRPKVAQDNPKLGNTEIVRLISKHWGSADVSLKERLHKEYKCEQQQYVERRANYDSKITDEQRSEIKQIKQDVIDAKERKILRRRIKQLGRPKKPPSAFLRFISEQRIANPQSPKQTYREWHQSITAKWLRFSESEKQVYIDKARSELERYKSDISSWEEKMIKQGNMDVVRHGNLIDPPEPKTK